MYIQMNLDGVEINSTKDDQVDTPKRPSFRALVSGMLSLGLGIVATIVGLMIGVTMMLIVLGLMPIALLWVWYVTRRVSATPVSVVATVASGSQTGHDEAQTPPEYEKDVTASTTAEPESKLDGTNSAHL